MKGLIVDLFAGGGGASCGIEAALGRPVDVAINHSALALAVHEANHPETRHLRGNVWSYAPLDVTGGRPVDLLWLSPTCTHFSKAKGGPLNRSEATKIRSLAWVARRWATDRRSRPAVIALENVSEFEDWGPLLRSGKPCPARKGQTFAKFIRDLERLGYRVEWQSLTACNYGAPTKRERLFLVARCDGEPISWPAHTHGPGLLPYRSAAECMDWSVPAPSIFDRKKPLVESTLRRIARGLQRFVLDCDRPHMVAPNLAATLIQRGYGERKGQPARCLDIRDPLGTVVAGGIKHAAVVAFIAKHFGGNESPGASLDAPLSTITCQDHHALVVASGYGDRRADVRQLLERYGERSTASLFGPRFTIADIGMRWLTPRELARAQGFSDDYRFDVEVDGKVIGTTKQVRLIGNSVSPPCAEALIRANFGAAESEAA